MIIIPSYADLHCHSTCSDGVSTPEELIALAAERGLRGLSITDHDTVAAYPGALDIAERNGMKLLTGVEFSTNFQGVNVHVLGYGFPMPNPLIEEYCQKHISYREDRNAAILELLRKEGMPIELHAEGDTVLGRTHIAIAMVENGYVATTNEAFKRYIGDGRKCFVTLKASPVEKMIQVIRDAGGLAILAHPHLITPPKVADLVMKKDFDGIEGYYASLTPEQEHYWVTKAEDRGLIVTGGSDYHSEELKPKNFLGSSWVGKETFDILYNHFLKKMKEL
ncbi:MAG: PHP domain-containing protein [Waddliaceae bacterium]|jgi:3',5'-nucleoside bisphosphate phosphatase|nr:PHP domain-containing protein [Waddliaceae bacterium]MBT3578782.1 PHP domain-containing protein [Waddliaceae bacterium]MBT4445319.1 PHP domain-containing protein [Waddliaceae bacterium]MBT6928615.1 PHP domain-containing protein [Waddliaceae bacterium]MBT7265121.1 PHP domain-containing protein [Waddliaceae bacterium]